MAEVFVIYRIYWYAIIMFDSTITYEALGKKFEVTLKFLYISEIILICFMIYIQLVDFKDSDDDTETNDVRHSLLIAH